MKILYGVQGTGNGHIARARLMAAALAKRTDVQVDYLFSGRKPDAYFDMEVFSNYQTRAGLTFVTDKGKVSKLKTLKQLDFIRLAKDINTLDLSQYNLVLNDFEPVTAWAAKLRAVPALSISHQAAFWHPIPTESDTFVDKWLTRNFAPTRHSLGVHWYHFDQAIIPPFVDPLFPKAKKSAKFVLVYLPFEELSKIQETLECLSEHQFHCYHPSVSKEYCKNNVHWFAPSKTGFHDALTSTSGVIANAGFELATECLSLGKPLLMKPLSGQYEQFSNAYTLRHLGLSHTLFELNADDIDEWIKDAKGLQITFPSNIDYFIDWIVKGDLDDTQSICRTLWQQVIYPQGVKQKFAQFN